MWCCFLCTFHCFLLLFTVFHCFPLLAAACDGNPAANLKANGHDVIPGQPMARASHILMANEGDLKRVQAQIAAGADFAELAAEHSTLTLPSPRQPAPAVSRERNLVIASH